MSKSAVESLISANKVMIFSKSYCPYCTACKSLFTNLSQPFHAVELDQESNGAEIQATLKEMTGQGTVPNVFISGKHIGGNSDCQEKAQSGDLQKLLGK
eukprot:CAMPEP_0174261688 /NCGR_PEP_ID=MMETSP0439-20130205/11825_1 /TAXON_ID=0 /ORGANISM="Stereomyxa ramosa, Strain Chinc5" /LENGTH=98 /DNA_ID=CAMNT_0015346215 /DNA_START=9 /DNA_END=305 /DNA_ORIENTATION=+